MGRRQQGQEGSAPGVTPVPAGEGSPCQPPEEGSWPVGMKHGWTPQPVPTAPAWLR